MVSRLESVPWTASVVVGHGAVSGSGRPQRANLARQAISSVLSLRDWEEHETSKISRYMTECSLWKT